MNSHRVEKQFALPTTSLGWCPFVWWGVHMLCHLLVGKSIVIWRCVKRGRVTVWISIWIKKIKRWEKWKGKLGGILMVSLTRKVNISIPMSKCSFWRVGCHQTASAWFQELSLGSTALEVCVPGSSHSTALSKVSPQGHGGILQERRSLLSYGGKGSVSVLALVSSTCWYQWVF